VIIFVHVREPLEIDKIVKKYGKKVTTVMIGAVGSMADACVVADNDADKHVKDYDYDIFLENAGDIKHLTNIADSFLTYLLKGKI